MAVSSIAVPPDPKRDARARALVDQVGTWPKHTLRQAWGSFEAGTTFRRASASSGARHYLVNAVACECPDYQRAGHSCKHVRAVVLVEQRQAVEVLGVQGPPHLPSLIALSAGSLRRAGCAGRGFHLCRWRLSRAAVADALALRECLDRLFHGHQHRRLDRGQGAAGCDRQHHAG
jgi:hypothetical protein